MKKLLYSEQVGPSPVSGPSQLHDHTGSEAGPELPAPAPVQFLALVYSVHVGPDESHISRPGGLLRLRRESDVFYLPGKVLSADEATGHGGALI